MIVKVCGMREKENILAVSSLDIQWMGFIFYARSPRSVTEIEPGSLFPAGMRQRRVGVFVDASPEYMMRIANAYRLDYLQLHGHESPDICYTLRKRGYALIKAFAIAEAEDFERTSAYANRVDYFLFDTRCEGHGGSGRSFDWSLLSAYKGDTPFLLSGGIRPESVEAIQALKLPALAGIDLNSGFERSPGIKDIGKLRDFIQQIQV